MQPLKHEIVYFESREEFNTACALRIAECAAAYVKRNGKCTLVLSGGNTPCAIYGLLATKFRNQFPWDKTFFFFGDERVVPPDHADSNFKMASENLFSKIPVDQKNIYRFETEKFNPEKAAQSYEAKIRNFFHLADGQLPDFDLVLLGLGTDGHTASLFPNSRALSESKRLVVSDYVEKLAAHRLTMTPVVFNRSHHVFFLVSGKEKKSMAEKIISAKHPVSELPATFIRPRQGPVTWFINQS